MKRPFFSACLLFCLSACTSLGIRMANLPARFDADHVKKDVAYGSQGWQKLDLYLPAGAEGGKKPLIVFFHGGRWTFGSKEDYPFVADTFTRRGYAVAIPDYAKYPAAVFPAFVEDAAAAVAWLHRHADEYGVDKDRLFVMGHSAGAHLGALVASDPRYLKAQGGSRAWVAGFAGLAGPYAFTPNDPDLVAMFGPPEHYAQIRATTFIDGKQPPMLLLHGGSDTDVGLFNLEQLQKAIEAKGGVVETRIYPGMDHIDIVSALTWLYRNKTPVAQDIDRFFRGIAARP